MFLDITGRRSSENFCGRWTRSLDKSGVRLDYQFPHGVLRLQAIARCQTDYQFSNLYTLQSGTLVSLERWL